MTTAARVLQIAAAEVGYDEGPRNANRYAPAVGHADNQPWCASFTTWVLREAGVPVPKAAESPYTPAAAAAWKRAGLLVTDPAPGDLAFFFWPSLGRIAHVGFVEKVLSPEVVQTIEGNTNAAGSRTGGSVLRKARKRSLIRVYARPAYGSGVGAVEPPTAPTAPPGPVPAPYPALLVLVGKAQYAVGPFGVRLLRSTAAVRDWQARGWLPPGRPLPQTPEWLASALAASREVKP